MDPGEDEADEAARYLALGRERRSAGDVEDAAAYFQTSLDLFPTAAAHVALGETLAAHGLWDEAIAECEKAIALDPDLGNAYNDIGVYRIEQGREAEALPWLDHALSAPVYDCRHFPHYHRGRILERAGRFAEARDAYLASVGLEEHWSPAQVALRRVLGFLN